MFINPLSAGKDNVCISEKVAGIMKLLSVPNKIRSTCYNRQIMPSATGSTKHVRTNTVARLPKSL